MNRLGLPYRQTPFALSLGLLALFVGLSSLQPVKAQTTPDPQETAVHYSLYYENFKNESWADALPDLRWVLTNAPGYPRNKDNNFERAVGVYEGLALEQETPEDKRIYLDSALYIYDQAVPTIQGIEGGEIDEFEWVRNKGRFIQKHQEDLSDLESVALESYRKAYDLDSKRIAPYYINIIFRGYLSNSDIGSALDFLGEVKETRGEEEEIKEMLKQYLQFIPPDEQITFLQEQLEEDPNNLETIKRLFELYQEEGGYRAEMMELAPRMMEMEPTPDILRLLMKMYIEDGQYEEATALFTQLETMPGIEMLPQDYHNMGIAQQEAGKYVDARNFYRKALDADSEYKDAQLAIANLYAAAVGECNPTERGDRAVYWLVADAFTRAGDSQNARRYRVAFPNAEDIFYEAAWEEGKSISVSYSCQGLTISGTTTVRKGG